MLIVDDNDTMKDFGELDEGDLFRKDGRYYLKTTGGATWNAVSLENGSVYLFSPGNCVEDLSRKHLQVIEDDAGD